jgi:acyl-homoserine-lactone acylase
MLSRLRINLLGLLFLGGLIISFGLRMNAPVFSTAATEILWDTWGVPHIYSQTRTELGHGFGYAQMQSHGDLILRLYGQARGRGAEYWGADYLASDRLTHTMGIPARAQAWDAAQTPAMRDYLTAFVAGLNTYATEHPDAISPQYRPVLPVTVTDVLAHLNRAIHFHFVVGPSVAGSNGWAIAPSRSESGHSLLLSNTHLPWGGLFLWYEADLHLPDLNLYGAALVGLPMLAVGFNDHLGWTATVNTHKGWTDYDLDLVEGGYRWDETVQPLEREDILLKVKQADGTLRDEPLTVERSRHGPIIRKDATSATALRVVGLDRAQILDQLWAMGTARDRPEFETALAQQQLPMFNFLTADRNGEIFYIFNGLVPLRPGGDWYDHQRPQPGDTAATLWTDYHPYTDLPQVANPANGWLQNTNDPPWTTTIPATLGPENFPAYLAPPDLTGAFNLLRTQRSLHLIQSQDRWSLEELAQAKFSTRIELGDRLVDDLIAAAQTDPDPLLQTAVTILKAWDHHANADSRGMALFAQWWAAMPPNSFAQPWDAAQPLTTPAGLADPAAAVATLRDVAQQMQRDWGRLDLPWGEFMQFRVGAVVEPGQGAAGALGSFAAIDSVPGAQPGDPWRVVGGDSFIAAVEFSDPVRALVLNPYGNATQADSPHRGDQLARYRQGDLREAWRDRPTIEAHLANRTILE